MEHGRKNSYGTGEARGVKRRTKICREGEIPGLCTANGRISLHMQCQSFSSANSDIKEFR